MKPEELRKLRRENNLTQLEIANKIGVSLSIVSKWENGINPIPKSKEKLIQKLLIDSKNYYNKAKEKENNTLNEAEVAFLNKEISEEEIATTVRNLVIHEKELETSLLFRTWRERLRVEAKNEALLEYMNSRK